MKIVIAGLGSAGRRHLRNLVAAGEKEILLLRTGRSTLPDSDLVGFETVTSLEQALEWNPEALVIANPTAYHLDLAIPAAKAGCHLLIEKPISHSLEQAQALENAVKGSGSQVLVGYQFRFHPGLKKAAELLRQEVIGRPLSVRVQWSEWLPGWHPWEDYRQSYSARAELGGGVVLTLSHPLDYLRWLFGEVAALWAFTGALSDLQINVEDTAEIGLKFQNNVIGSLHLDYNGQPSTHHLEVLGTRGTLRWDNHTGSVSWYSKGSQAGELPPAGADGWQSFPPPSGFERNDLFMAEIRHFLAVCRGAEQPVCTLEDGIMALKVSLAILKAASSGQVSKF